MITDNIDRLPSTIYHSDWLARERKLWADGLQRVAGVDEAGRGPIAGPVVAAAVILPVNLDLPGVVDSKLMSPRQREEAYRLIRMSCTATGISAASNREIDRIGILNATMSAMRRAVLRLSLPADFVLVDGNRYPDGLNLPGEAIIGGDRRSRTIAAASVVAKVIRDRLMVNLGRIYTGYSFAEHKGYCTAQHRLQLNRYGPTHHHRLSFAPIRQQTLFTRNDG